MLDQVDKGIATLVATRDAVKGARWDDADRHLSELLRLIHSLRLDIRDERLPVHLKSYRAGIVRRVFAPARPALTCHPEEVAPNLWRRHREPHPQPELVLEIILSKNDRA